MTHTCENCGDLLEGNYPCDTCGYDPAFEEYADDPELVFDGGRVVDREEWSAADHLEAALEKADSRGIRFHVRAALQYRAYERGEIEDERPLEGV